MRWPDYGTRIKYLYQWHRWFAWHPVNLWESRETAWLELVERRISIADEYGITFEYQAIKQR